MTRLTRRTWRRTAVHTAVATLCAADAAGLAATAMHDRSAAELTAAVALAWLAVVALVSAASWSWAAGRATVRDRRRPRPAGRPLWTSEVIEAQRKRAADDERAHAEAMAAVAAEPLAPQPQTVAYTAVMPTVAVRHAGIGAAVATALPLPWWPPVAEPRVTVAAGRHAGRAA
jgi:hypothetical protein